MNMRGLLFGSLVTALVGAASPASAVELVGSMNITGTVEVTATSISWFPNSDLDNDGVATLTGPSSGYFHNPGNGGAPIYVPESGDGGPTTASILNLNFGITPPGVLVSVPNFLTGFADSNAGAPNNFNPEYSDLTFELTMIQIPNPVLGACVDNAVYLTGQSCRLGVFLLTQNDGSVTASLNILGIFEDPSLGIESLTATGRFSTQSVAGFTTIDQLGDHLSAGNSVRTSYSAEFVAPTVPEPATLITFGVGSLLAARARRRKKN